MDLKWLYLSTKGRIGRKQYLLAILPFAILGMVLAFVDYENGVPVGQIGPLQTIGIFIGIYPGIALGVKRAHDRGRSGWFYLILFVPLLCIWPVVEFVFLKGDSSENQYGPNPLEESPSSQAA